MADDAYEWSWRRCRRCRVESGHWRERPEPASRGTPLLMVGVLWLIERCANPWRCGICHGRPSLD